MQGYPTMHDDQHIARLYSLIEAMSYGEWYGRWVKNLVFGLGYPLFNFYPPLAYYITLPFYLITQELITSVKLMMIAGLIAGAYGTYLFTKELSNKWTGILAAIVYSFFPYRAVLTFVRGAFADFWAVSLAPFVYWAIVMLSKEISTKNSIILGISVGLIILSHQIQTIPMILFGLPVAGYSLYLVPSSNKLNYVKALLFAGVIAFGVSAFFSLPLFFEKGYTLVDTLNTSNLYDFHLHFVIPTQLWFSPWGYGGSVSGLADGMSYQLGKAFIAGLIGALILGGGVLLFRKKKISEQWLIVSALTTLGTLIMATAYSSLIWENLPFIPYVQFPWRLLGFTNIFIAVTIALGLSLATTLFSKRIPILSRSRILVMGSIILALALTYQYGKLFVPQEMRALTDKEMTSGNKILWDVSSTSFEFAPRGLSLSKTPPYGNLTPPIKESDLPYPEIIAREVEYTVAANTPTLQKFIVTNSGETKKISFGTFNFPGWHAQINNEPVEITSDNPLQLMEVEIPEGDSTITLSFTDTPIRAIGNTITLTTWTLIVLYMISKKSVYRKES